jgi:hypothetical protein
MPIYDKPVHEIMKEEMVPDLLGETDQTFTKQDATNWFHEHYPKIKPDSVAAMLSRIVTNSNSRMHYRADINGADDVLFQVSSSTYRLYETDTDPTPVYNFLNDRSGTNLSAISGFGAPVDQIFDSEEHAEWAFDLMLNTLDHLSIYDFEDERYAVILVERDGGQNLRFLGFSP